MVTYILRKLAFFFAGHTDSEGHTLRHGDGILAIIHAISHQIPVRRAHRDCDLTLEQVLEQNSNTTFGLAVGPKQLF